MSTRSAKTSPKKPTFPNFRSLHLNTCIRSKFILFFPFIVESFSFSIASPCCFSFSLIFSHFIFIMAQNIYSYGCGCEAL